MVIFTKKVGTLDPHLPIVWDKVPKKYNFLGDIFLKILMMLFGADVVVDIDVVIYIHVLLMLMFLLILIPLLVGGYWTEDLNLGAAAKYPKDLVCMEIGNTMKYKRKQQHIQRFNLSLHPS